MNLFTGIMFEKFNKAWSKEKNKGISNNPLAERYWDFLKQLPYVNPEFHGFKLSQGKISKFVYDYFANNKYFDYTILSVIVLNIVVMAMNYEGAPSTYVQALDYLNLIFTIIFILEACLKIIALGFNGYFYYSWNVFDFFVVSCSIVDLIISNATASNNTFLKSFQIIRIMRLLRITRVLRVIRSLKGLEKLLMMLKWSMTALSNIFILMFLVFCIFAIMGCYIYDGINYTDYKSYFNYVNEYHNFDNFYYSFLLVFRQMTGENWPLVMMEFAKGIYIYITLVDKYKSQEYTAFLYFICMNFTTFFILLNLFTLVTIQLYDEFNDKLDNPVEKFNEIVNEFRKAWNKYSSQKEKGLKIRSALLPNVFYDLQGDLTKGYVKNIEKINKYIYDLRLMQ
jgi:hypothetical protein